MKSYFIPETIGELNLFTKSKALWLAVEEHMNWLRGIKKHDDDEARSNFADEALGNIFDMLDTRGVYLDDFDLSQPVSEEE